MLSKIFFGQDVILYDGITYKFRIQNIFNVGFSKSSIIISDAKNAPIKNSSIEFVKGILEA